MIKWNIDTPIPKDRVILVSSFGTYNLVRWYEVWGFFIDADPEPKPDDEFEGIGECAIDGWIDIPPALPTRNGII